MKRATAPRPGVVCTNSSPAGGMTPTRSASPSAATETHDSTALDQINTSMSTNNSISSANINGGGGSVSGLVSGAGSTTTGNSNHSLHVQHNRTQHNGRSTPSIARYRKHEADAFRPPRMLRESEEEDRLEYSWATVAGWVVGAVLMVAMATWVAFACAYAGESAARERTCQRMLFEAQTEVVRCHDAAVLRAVDSHARAASPCRTSFPCSAASATPLPCPEATIIVPCPCVDPASAGPPSSEPEPQPTTSAAVEGTNQMAPSPQCPWWPGEEEPHVSTLSSADAETTTAPDMNRLGDMELSAERAISSGGPDPGFRPIWNGSLGFFPNRTAWDPYQSALYARSDEFGMMQLSKEQMWNLTIGYEHPKHRKHYRYVFHLHWVAMVCTKETIDDAAKELKSVLEFFQWIEEQGWYIVWTIHHVMDPSCTPELYPLQIQLLQTLTDRADVIHLFCQETIALTEPYYSISPSKVITVPQGSFLGLYSDVNLTQILARRTLALHTPFVSDTDDLVLLFIGSIKRHKGLAELVNAFNAVSVDMKNIQVWIVGEVSTVEQLKYSDAEWLQIEAAINANPAIKTWYGRVHDDDLQFYYKAADAVVLPYVRDSVLSSGTLLTSLSFGRPVIAPPMDCMEEWLTEETSIVFSPTKGNNTPGHTGQQSSGADESESTLPNLEEALRQARKLRAESYREAALAKAQRYTYRDMSNLFFEKLKWRI